MDVTPIIAQALDGWFSYLRSGDPELLDAVLDDDVVFYSPIVFTPQVGRAITSLYLRAAGQTLPGSTQIPPSKDAAGSKGAFQYTKQLIDDDTAVLEFETTIDGKYVNGVDIIRCNEDGKIVEFRVMIRPLQAVNIVHEQMRATLERLSGTDGHS